MTDTEKLSDLAGACAMATKRGASIAWDKRDEWQRSAFGWRCTLHYQGRRYSFDFWMGPGNVDRHPDKVEALECLLSDASAGDMTFDEFCSDMGYDTDSRKAFATYQACYRVTRNMRRLLGDDYERFLYADR